MSETMLWSFWALSMSLTLTPGADWAYVMSAGMKNKVFTALLGMLLGYLLVIFAVMAGVGALVVAFPVLLQALTFLGAAYLLWLGKQVLCQPPAVGESQGEQQPARQWIVKGIAVSGLNPKVLLMFLALIPQFLTAQTNISMPVQTLFFGLIHIANCALIYPFVGLGVGISLRYRPDLSRWISRFSGVAMITIALLLLGEQVYLI
ncbi:MULTISPECIES: LysE family translocator [Glaesserella]|uniref:Lysine transporter LysE n=1 Tax=Glaesserella australis TaxID=2094024 RepID=A0A328BX91_9PAST|nr:MULTISPECIES: LysE family translocator [Glaesserella]AUI66015.1 lysine transporter LysE [Glaesserella sp. 15-184]RAL18265.1 lysine transporter LysE [Glaesserella australis]